jgi:hypothetical protein
VKGIRFFEFLIFLLALVVVPVVLEAQNVPYGTNPSSGGQSNFPRPNQNGRQRPLLGKITAIKEGSLELTRPDGGTVTVKLTDKTEFRKDRKAAQLSDFKVGDLVMIRGEENPDHTVTAQLIATRTGGPGGGRMVTGEMGKDFVVGEVKSIDPPRMTVLREDNVTQTLELNEDTSLRRGRESITMADIQVGDHVMARGSVQNNVFVPKFVMDFNAEQWKRMQENGMFFRSGPNGAQPAPQTGQPEKPKEQPN